jgi:hypothetical protein
MRLQADALDLPADFVLVSEELTGMRSTFMAAHAPEVQREYAAPWDGGKLCDRVRSLAESSSGGCRSDTQIWAGWRAWPVNVWSYKVFVSVMPPDSTRLSEDDCIEIRERQEQQVRSGARPYENIGWARAWCWVPPGHALVMVTIRGGQGWFGSPE